MKYKVIYYDSCKDFKFLSQSSLGYYKPGLIEFFGWENYSYAKCIDTVAIWKLKKTINNET